MLNKKANHRGAWQAQSVEHLTLDLGVVSLSPRVGVEITLKKKKKKQTCPLASQPCNIYVHMDIDLKEIF